MRKLLFIVAVFAAIILLVVACKTPTQKSSLCGNNVFANYDARDTNTRTLLDLFYGMAKNPDGKYFCTELDTIKHLLHKEYSSIWLNNEDPVCFNMCIGLYIDTVFPSTTVKRIMLEKIDSVMTDGMSCDLPEDELISLKSQMYVIPDSIPLFLKLWNWNFDRWTKVYNSKASKIKFNKILDSRGCVVCHKIYEDPSWVTYILESSVSYHGSLGCPSSADYVTIDKNTGYILSKEDILSDPNIDHILEMLPIEYGKAAIANQYEPSSWWDSNGDGLFNQSNGVALINEGLLIYFVPYNIGCGAEGQYNLIVPIQ